MSLSIVLEICVEFVSVLLPKPPVVFGLTRFPASIAVQLFRSPLGELVRWKRLLAAHTKQRLVTLLLNLGFTRGFRTLLASAL